MMMKIKRGLIGTLLAVAWFLPTSLQVFAQLLFLKSIEPHPLKGTEQFRQLMVNDLGDLYLIEQSLAEVYKLDSTGTILKRNGGFGWAPPQLNQPVDLCTSNGIDVLIVDKVNQQLLFFDRQLNFLTNIPLSNHLEGNSYPVSLAASRYGEIFVLLAEHNAQVLKLETAKHTVTSFGGFEYADYALQQPRMIRLDPRGMVVIAEQNGTLIEFDRYGTPLLKIKPPKAQQITGLVAQKDYRLLFDSSSPRLLLYSKKSSTWSVLEAALPPKAKRIISGFYAAHRLYLLFDSNIIGVYAIGPTTLPDTLR